jgi:ribonuclease HI
MTKKNFYAVSRGETTGIFTRWSKGELSIHKYSNAVFKGFETIDEAIAFLIAKCYPRSAQVHALS